MQLAQVFRHFLLQRHNEKKQSNAILTYILKW